MNNQKENLQTGATRRQVLLGLGAIPFGLKALTQEAGKNKTGVEQIRKTTPQERLGDEIRINGFPELANPRRIAGSAEFPDNHNTIGGGTEIMIADPGVVGRYDFHDPEHKDNPSSVHLTGRNERTYTSADGRPEVAALPANGYTEFAFAYAQLTVGEQTVVLPDLGPDHSYITVIQGYDGDGRQDTDHSDTIIVSDYKPGHTSVKELGVPLRHGSFRSEVDTLNAVLAAHGVSYTSRGDGGTSRVTLVVWSPQEGAIAFNQSTIVSDQPKELQLSDLKDWQTLYSNIK